MGKDIKSQIQKTKSSVNGDFFDSRVLVSCGNPLFCYFGKIVNKKNPKFIGEKKKFNLTNLKKL